MAQDRDPAELALFDGDAFLEALRQPALRLEGRTYVGRLLSFEEWGRFAHRFTPTAAGVAGDVVLDARRFRRLVRDIVTAVFGRGRPWWAVWRPTVAQRLLRQPMAVQVEALKSFSQSQTAAFGADAARLAATPNGTTPARTTA
jgi:hypothetical protein